MNTVGPDRVQTGSFCDFVLQPVRPFYPVVGCGDGVDRVAVAEHGDAGRVARPGLYGHVDDRAEGLAGVGLRGGRARRLDQHSRVKVNRSGPGSPWPVSAAATATSQCIRPLRFAVRPVPCCSSRSSSPVAPGGCGARRRLLSGCYESHHPGETRFARSRLDGASCGRARAAALTGNTNRQAAAAQAAHDKARQLGDQILFGQPILGYAVALTGLAALVIDPWDRCPPEEDSVGTNPR